MELDSLGFENFLQLGAIFRIFARRRFATGSE